jgi:hypothetical protein
MILGLDISTSITGYTILSGQAIVKCDKLDLRNKKYVDFFDKSVAAKQLLQEIKQKFTIDQIWIEETLNVMSRGMSSAHTIMTLNRFNGIISWQCYEIFNIRPRYVSARQARKLVGVQIPKGSDAKQCVFNFLLANEPQFKVEYSKFGNPVQGTFDRADSLVIAKAGQLLCQSQSSVS